MGHTHTLLEKPVGHFNMNGEEVFNCTGLDGAGMVPRSTGFFILSAILKNRCLTCKNITVQGKIIK